VNYPFNILLRTYTAEYEYEHISDSLNTAVRVLCGFRGYHSCMHG